MTIPDNIITEDLGIDAFADCTEIEYLKIPISIDIGLGSRQFKNVSKIKEVFFSKGTGISPDYSYASRYTATPWYQSRENILNGLNNIQQIIFTGNATEWNQITIGSGNNCLSSIEIKCLE